MRLRKKMTVGFLPTLFVLVAMLVVACGGSGGGTTPTTQAHTPLPASQQIYITGTDGAGVADIATFDPALDSDLTSAYAIYRVFTGLVELNDQLGVSCVLCTTYSVGSDGVTWTFNLKPGLKFSDGTPLTSQDVVYSIDRALDPALASPVGPYYLRYIKDATKRNDPKSGLKSLIGDSLLAPDPNTVKIIASQPAAFFLDTLTYPTSWVVEKKVIDQYGKSWTDHLADNGGQGGAGPFKVQEYTHNKQIVFVPNPNYSGPKPQLQKVVMPFYKAADTTYQVYQVNGVDDAVVPLSDYETAKTKPDFRQHPQLSIFYYAMNFNTKPFDVISCRQAFALAINKDLIVKSVWKNSVFATNHIVPQGQPGYNANLKGPDGSTSTSGNTTQAKADLQDCLTKQGYSSVSQIPAITLTYASSGVQAARNEVAAMQQMWQTVLGISVKTNDVDFNKLIGDEQLGCSNPLQFYAGPGWIVDYPDPQDWITLQFDKGQAQNGMCFGQNKGSDAPNQVQLQQQMEAADVNQNNTARMAAYNSIEQQLVNDVAWFPMYQGQAFGVRKPCVQGIVPNAFGLIPPDDWAKIYISTDTPCAKTS